MAHLNSFFKGSLIFLILIYGLLYSLHVLHICTHHAPEVLLNVHTFHRVGNLLGSGQPYIARLSAWLCVAVGGMFMAFFACMILIARNYVGMAFTNDQAVIGVMASIAPLAALFQVCFACMADANKPHIAKKKGGAPEELYHSAARLAFSFWHI